MQRSESLITRDVENRTKLHQAFGFYLQVQYYITSIAFKCICFLTYVSWDVVSNFTYYMQRLYVYIYLENCLSRCDDTQYKWLRFRIWGYKGCLSVCLNVNLTYNQRTYFFLVKLGTDILLHRLEASVSGYVRKCMSVCWFLCHMFAFTNKAMVFCFWTSSQCGRGMSLTGLPVIVKSSQI